MTAIYEQNVSLKTNTSQSFSPRPGSFDPSAWVGLGAGVLETTWFFFQVTKTPDI